MLVSCTEDGDRHKLCASTGSTHGSHQIIYVYVICCNLALKLLMTDGSNVVFQLFGGTSKESWLSSCCLCHFPLLLLLNREQKGTPVCFLFLTCKTQTVTMLFSVVGCSCIRCCGISLDHYMTTFFLSF